MLLLDKDAMTRLLPGMMSPLCPWRFGCSIFLLKGVSEVVHALKGQSVWGERREAVHFTANTQARSVSYSLESFSQ